MAMSADLLLTVLGDPDVVIEPAGEDPPLRVGPADVRPLVPTPEERADGASRYEVTVDGWVLQVRVESASRAALRERARRGASSTAAHARVHVRAQIPGRVVRVWVEPGQQVSAGERLLAIEAMKMENEVRAPRAGVVASLGVELGQPVELGMELAALD
jgi:biotin carboxyl carrier protein